MRLGGGRTRHGWLVCSPDGSGPGEMPQNLAGYGSAVLPPADRFALVLEYARTVRCSYVLLDCGAVPTLDLPVLHHREAIPRRAVSGADRDFQQPPQPDCAPAAPRPAALSAN